jgi:ABC-type oligopeptide transport system ATPase subunit
VSEGQILYKSRPLQQMTRTERLRFRQKVQVVFQDSSSALNPRRTIGGTLRDSLRLGGLRSGERDAAAGELLGKVGLSREYSRRYPHELSGGQRQRVGIARALAMQPEVIIADEPVSALDVSLQGQIINLLLRLQREMDLTIVLISHDIAVVRHSCQRVAVMYEGKLVEIGDVSQVVFEPRHPYTKRLIAAVPKGFDPSHTLRETSVNEA